MPNVKEVSCDQLWLPFWILSLRSGQTFPLRPNMVWLMWCKWGISNTLAIQLYLALSHFHISCRTFSTSLLDEANAFFWPWHFKVPVVWKKLTVSNYARLILARQNHEHASEIASPDKTLFYMKGRSLVLWAAGWRTVRHAKKVTFTNQLHRESLRTKKKKRKNRKKTQMRRDNSVLQTVFSLLWKLIEMNAVVFTEGGRVALPKIILFLFIQVHS